MYSAHTVTREAVTSDGARPDPLLTANLYCAGRLDQALRRFVAPLWRDFRELKLEHPCLLWVLRYPNRGEHLKLRVHAEEGERERLGRCLGAAADSFVSGLAAAATTQVRPFKGRRASPASLDEEDDEPGLARDPSFLRTRYRRSPALFGDEPLLRDDTHVMRLVQCFSAGCEQVLTKLGPGESGELAHGAREAALLEIVISGLAALGEEPGDSRAYLAFHRDWIIRYPVLVTRKGPDKAQEILALLDRHLATISSATREDMRRRAEAAWAAGETGEHESVEACFRDALCGLRESLLPHRDEAEFALDPFARGPVFPMFFKVFHLVANQLGVGFLDEAFAYHLLLCAMSAGQPAPTFILVPTKLEEPAPGSSASESSVHTLSANYPWNFYVALASAEGSAWVERFFAAHRDALSWAREALTILRAHDLGPDRFSGAAALLDRALGRMQALAREDPAAHGVLGRFYFGTVAYYHYCRGDSARAAVALDEANAHLIAAVDAERILLPATPLSADIPLQKARIARRQRRWEEMVSHLRELCDVQAGRRPLCILADGTEVDYDMLGGVYAGREELSAEERRAIRGLVDLDERLHWANRRVQDLFAPAHLLIGYR